MDSTINQSESRKGNKSKLTFPIPGCLTILLGPADSSSNLQSQKCYVHMDVDDALDYNKVKSAILLWIELNCYI